MIVGKDLLPGIQRYLDAIPAGPLTRGRSYFSRGAVLELQCLEPDRLYTAVVQGGEDYQVGLEFFDGDWAAECSCPMAVDCKHIVAALLELQSRASANVGPSTSVRERIAAAAEAHWAKLRLQSIAQPAPSPLLEKLTGHFGRALLRDEADFIRLVQSTYSQVRFRSLVESDLRALGAGALASSTVGDWKPVKLWAELPRDDYQFWLHVAWELHRRNARWLAFMNGITDLSLIEPLMRDWERAKQIEHWKNWFRDLEVRRPAVGTGVLELRLVVLADEARLQWRTRPDLPFGELKPAQAKRFSQQFDDGELAFASNSLPLWSAAYKPWDAANWWSFKYDDQSAQPALNRLLRLELAPDCVVTADGQPLPRAAEPLRLKLDPPQDGDPDYKLMFATAEGRLPPRLLCVFPGQPTVYLTEGGLFHGSPHDALEPGWQRSIPAVALETTDGVRFLHAHGVLLPEDLQRRVRIVPVAVTISCGLKPVYPGSASEDIVIAVRAKAPGMPMEKFTPQGWQPASPSEAQRTFGSERGVFTVHDRSHQRHFPPMLDLLGPKWGGYPGDWRLRLTKKTPETFVSWLKSLPVEIEVLLDSELATLRDEPVSGTVSLDIEEAGIDWFDIKVAMEIGDTKLTPEELKLLLNARGGYVRLGKKGWRRLQFNLTPEEDEQLARLGLHARDFSGEPQRFHALQLADPAAKRFLAPEQVERIQRRVSELKCRVSPAQPQTIRAEMRPYQTDGFHFLAYLTSNRFGGVLADDMGLGKTLQALAWLAWLRETSPGSGSSTLAPALVVCPKSVMDNWRAEAERFYPSLRVILWRSAPGARLSLARESADLIIINYPQLRSLSPEITKVHWLAAILDEAQCIKNPDSQTAQVARTLQADYRLALTGTPIENRLLDLWSILAFSMPGALGNRAHFLRRFDAKDDPLARRRLAARVRPFLLRRTKAQVAKELPDRIEEDLLCEMEGLQQKLYRAELKRARQLILGLKTNQQLNAQRFNILTSLLRLRQICCHPGLVDGQARDAGSAKLDALVDLLGPLMEEGHKVLVFSQFVTMLDLLREAVQQREWPHFYLAGDTENRGELVREFQAANGGAVFLISLKAGGFGLNLMAASYVVLFDPWWNPAVENQAIDRTHRIGQTNKVMAYRLLIRDSIEQKIRLLQKQKAALADDVLGEERFAQALTLDDLRCLFAE